MSFWLIGVDKYECTNENNLNKGVKAPIWRMMQEGENNG